MKNEDLGYYEQMPASGKAPAQLMILLHGLGADGRDLMGLAPYFAEGLQDTVFVAPDAPQACDMAPVGRQWFSLQDWSPQTLLEGAESARPALDAFIEKQLVRFSLSPQNLFLCGFSQGACMALYSGLRFREPVAGILGYSGWLTGSDELERLSARGRPPVHLVHGSADQIVPAYAWTHAKDALESAGYEVSGLLRPGLAHGIDEEGLESGMKFLRSAKQHQSGLNCL